MYVVDQNSIQHCGKFNLRDYMYLNQAHQWLCIPADLLCLSLREVKLLLWCLLSLFVHSKKFSCKIYKKRQKQKRGSPFTVVQFYFNTFIYYMYMFTTRSCAFIFTTCSGIQNKNVVHHLQLCSFILILHVVLYHPLSHQQSRV